ncbi:hypothetical protein GMD78_04985 [Ornithinibacillus sp. L9]|uniref:Uncharacterized protein n=1 Tax=Ornithinibacillus caprae TaxID=2678566 RepID=A0A6N8FGF1_9BACI|nr:hypothetical protein [Ornithinibacillus caprae]MUK87756.1 hypothetical protein [Ornithinibacillus caprae]
MQIFSTFEHSSYLELVLSVLKEIGIDQHQIMAVPMNNRTEERKLFDTLHRSDGISLFDKGAAIAVAFSVIGTSIGFVLEWGPIYWGLIAGTIGFLVGFLIDLFIYKVLHKRKRILRGKKSEVVLVIECPKEQAEKVEKILWDHLALGVARIEV